MNTCQHCGAEITNPRAKNCAECSAILTDANRRGVYATVTAAIATAKANGLAGDDVRAAMRAAMTSGQAERNAKLDAIRKEREERNAAYCQERARRERFYALHGYWPGQADPMERDENLPTPPVRGDGHGDIEY